MEEAVSEALKSLFSQYAKTKEQRKQLSECVTQQLAKLDQQLTEGSSSPNERKPVRVYIDGCFDIMHSGHYNALRQAKQLGDILVAGVHSDAEILKNKGTFCELCLLVC
jgi:cytidyltransferase-like protein